MANTARPIPNFTKHPSGKNRLKINTNRTDSAVVSSASFTSTPSGLTFENIQTQDEYVTVLIGGGADGTVYKVNGPIVLDNLEIPVAEFHVTVRNVP